MKALGAGLLATTIFIVSVGFFRLWFVLPSPASEARNDRLNVNLKIDADITKQDAKADDQVNDNLKSTNR
jgi:hypothetical protein